MSGALVSSSGVTLVEIAVAIAIAAGLAGMIVPVLPGAVLIAAAILVWALEVGGSTAWIVFGVALALLVLGSVVKFLVPGRRLQAAGVPNRSLWAGAGLGVVGFFVIPVVGIFVGFVLGIYLAEWQRVGRDAAWPSTKHALKATGLSILIELVAGVLAAAAWAVGVVLT